MKGIIQTLLSLINAIRELICNVQLDILFVTITIVHVGIDSYDNLVRADYKFLIEGPLNNIPPMFMVYIISATFFFFW